MTDPPISYLRERGEEYVSPLMDAMVRFAVTPDGVSLAWAAHGEGPVLVLSRGWITHLEHSMATPAQRDFVGALATRFTVVRYDGRGNGMSDWDVPRPITFEHLVVDLETIVAAVGADELVLWGSSWGGPPAIAFAADHPARVTRLVLDGTFADGQRLADPARRQAFLSLFDVAAASPDAVFAALSHLTNPEGHDATSNLAARGRGSIRADVAKELYTLLYDIDVSDRLAQVAAPTLVLHRRRSRAVPFDCGRRVAAGIPGATLVALEGSAHNLWDHEPDEALAAMGRFLGVAMTVQAPVDATGGPTTAILFSDVVASTSDQHRLGDGAAYGRQRIHDEEARAAIARFGGREVKHTGDGIMAAFPAARAAVAAAQVFQSRLAERRAQEPGAVPDVAIGINVGEPLVDAGGDLHGLAVAVAARACAEAGAGEIIVTPVVCELTAGSGPRYRSVGERSLKGLDRPLELFAVEP